MKVTGFQDTINWYNQNAAQYAKSIQNIAALKLMDDFVSLLPTTNKKVLDAGCAAGRDSKLLSEMGAEITGIDLSPELLQIAKAKLPKIPFINGNFLDLPFENNTFGGVWSHASLLHCETIDDVLMALREFNRVLVDGGILHVYLKVNTQNKKFDIVKDTLTHHDRFFQYFTNNELKDLLLKSGFKLISIENEEDRAGRAEVLWVVSLSRK